MGLFAGLGAGTGRLPEGRRRNRVARAGGASGERRSRQKLNARRCPLSLKNAGLGRSTLSNMANKLLKNLWVQGGAFLRQREGSKQADPV